MTGHARLKNEFTKDEKYHNFMTWLFISLRKYHTKSYLTNGITMKKVLELSPSCVLDV